MTPTVTITPESQARWRALVKEWSDTMRKGIPDVLVWAGWRTAVSCRARAPLCKAKLGLRDIEENPEVAAELMKFGVVNRYRIKVYSQHDPEPKYYLTNDMADPRRVIRWAGAAKNSWNGIMRGLGKTASPATGMGRGADTGTGTKHLTGDVPYVELANSLSYMDRIFPNSFEYGLTRVMNQMEARMTKLALKGIGKAA